MEYKALIGFSGAISMAQGEKREIKPEIAKDLLNAGYIEAVKPAEKDAKPKVSKKSEKTEKGA